MTVNNLLTELKTMKDSTMTVLEESDKNQRIALTLHVRNRYKSEDIAEGKALSKNVII